ncbi:MAG: energy-coupling factor ABC transporter permease [Lachnospiraceae bacterium]
MKQFSKNQKTILMLSMVIACMGTMVKGVSAMHIMEGYLPVGQCIIWGAISLPFLVLSFFAIKKTVKEQRKALLLLAMSGAFIFVISSLKIPSVTGSCSHMTGTGLAAILFGPFHSGILGLIVLVFQAIMLAHGGLTSLGANTFSMSIAGPIITWLLYKAGCSLKVNRKVNIVVAAMLGDLLTYCVTSMQLAIAYPSEVGGVLASLTKFLGVFAPTQLPLAFIEGIITLLIIMGLETYAKPELKAIGFLKTEK